MFRAILMEKGEDGAATARLATLEDSALPLGEVTVAVEYSTVNYKDGLCLSATGGGLVRTWPHVPGIDFAGVVEASEDARYRPGDRVVLTGWRVGEAHWGGFAEKARVKADWLVALPAGISTREAMAVGTAGFTAAQALMALEAQGLRPDQGEVLVDGGRGGRGVDRRGAAGAGGLPGGRGDGAARDGGLSDGPCAPRGSCRATRWPRR